MNRHDFLVLRFCVANLSERIFTLEQIFVGKIFAVMWGNVYLRQLIFSDRWKNRKNW